METKDTVFLKKLLAMFKIEAREHLNMISTELLRLAKGDSNNRAEIVETMFRETHTLKGAARSVNLEELVSICQSIENVFLALKRQQITFSQETGGLLHQTIDFCHRMVEGEKSSTAERAAAEILCRQLDDLATEQQPQDVEKSIGAGQELRQWREMEEGPHTDRSSVANISEPSRQTPGAVSVPVVPETVRMSRTALDSLLLRAEEMISCKIATGQRLADLRDLQKAYDSWKKEQQRDHPVGFSLSREGAGEVSADPYIASFAARLTALVRTAEDDHRTSGALIDALLDDMKKTLMLPFSSILELFPRFVRDLARSGHKQVECITEGGEIEIDRRVLEEMKDPLIHLVRNCLDHGIELPDERRGKNKSAGGNIRIRISSRDGKIEIAVSDDGRGLDAADIKSAAVKQALISQEAADMLGEEESLQLVFQSGMTTSPIITDLSGRGLGLAIVREKVEKLNGTVTVDTVKDQGTTFRLVVPLTLATFRGTLIRISGQLFVLPSTNVEKVTRARKEAIQTVENRETLLVDSRPVAFVRLADVLGVRAVGERHQPDDTFVQVAVVCSAEKRMAFMVDEILCEQEVLVKPLGRQLARVRNIMGATVLDGRVVPVLNASDLLKTAVKKVPEFTAGIREELAKRSAVLIVEDSVTARALLKNIIESAGYDVQTAVDGIDAMAALKRREFNIVVSDVEMPRMNGFELAAKIRADKKLAELPVVLVTALESREDKERGIDVGANAYIVKSSFEQSNLLEVIGRLT